MILTTAPYFCRVHSLCAATYPPPKQLDFLVRKWDLVTGAWWSLCGSLKCQIDQISLCLPGCSVERGPRSKEVTLPCLCCQDTNNNPCLHLPSYARLPASLVKRAWLLFFSAFLALGSCYLLLSGFISSSYSLSVPLFFFVLLLPIHPFLPAFSYNPLLIISFVFLSFSLPYCPFPSLFTTSPNSLIRQILSKWTEMEE